MMVTVELNEVQPTIQIRLAEGYIPDDTFKTCIYTDGGHPIIIFWLTGKPKSDEIWAQAEIQIIDFVVQLMKPYWSRHRR
jgi:hypothetical protein